MDAKGLKSKVNRVVSRAPQARHPQTFDSVSLGITIHLNEVAKGFEGLEVSVKVMGDGKEDEMETSKDTLESGLSHSWKLNGRWYVVILYVQYTFHVDNPP